jgi:signal transduction histidine kinase
MIGIRQKLMLGFGGLLAFIVLISILTIHHVDRLGQAIDVILKENYHSIVACQNMKESLERIDSGILFILAGNELEGNRLIREYTEKFRSSLEAELGNITLPGEKEKAERIKSGFTEYTTKISRVSQSKGSLQSRQLEYFSELQPLFQEIKALSQGILIMNQKSMVEASEKARKLASYAHRRMVAVVIVSALLSLLFSYLVHRWILRPIHRLIESTNEIRHGNLNLSLNVDSRDEIGQLSASFNEMASVLRRLRKEDQLTLFRTQRITSQVLNSLPEAIAVIDPDGRVEISTKSAERIFGLYQGIRVDSLGYSWLPPLIHKALDGNHPAASMTGDDVIQIFTDNRELFFQPMAVPIQSEMEYGDTVGAVLILNDVTRIHELAEMKQGVVATVSHQLKTPLTSLRMSVHILLDEVVGPVNEKQKELLVTAREDSERLSDIVDDLLDLNRIESGNALVTLSPVAPWIIVRDAVEQFIPESLDKGVKLSQSVGDNLPDILADREKLSHVFTNILSNALRFTPPGGMIAIEAMSYENNVTFTVSDTGSGIPHPYLDKIFDPFFRVPGQNEKSGVGLGLSIAREIIQAHGGTIRAESLPDKGSTFILTLPLAP